MKRAHVLINPTAGAVSTLGVEGARDLILERLSAAGYGDVDFVVGPALDLIESCRERMNARDADLVVTAGGDGTVAAIAGVLAGGQTPLLPLPGGTMNMLANDLGMPMDFGAALIASLEAAPRPIDIGFIGERAFVNNIVFGAYADIAEARENLRDAQSVEDTIDAITQAATAVVSAAPHDYLVASDNIEITTRTNTLLISNNPYTGARGLQPVRSSLDHGKLCIYLPKSKTVGDMFSRMIDALSGKLEASETVNIVELVRCTVEAADGSMNVSIDGDPVEMVGPVDVRIAAAAIRICAPELERTELTQR